MIPCFYEETLTGTIQKDAQSILLSNRIIMLFGQITDEQACAVVS